MEINWMIVATIAAPILAGLIGAWANDRFRRGARLIAYFGHASAFTVRDAKDLHGKPIPPFVIHTHTLSVRNVGRAAATNLRIGPTVNCTVRYISRVAGEAKA